jgi:ubiquinone/menaquinone biosynthesis C-methylase UbiE
VATRAASALAGPGARVVGFDLNHGMLAVARRIRGDLEWRQGDAASMPFPDAGFDRVLCQFGLMFMPDRARALSEMRRVIAAGGGLGMAIWGGIENSPPYAQQADIVERLIGSDAAAIVRAPFALSDPEPLVALVEAAGFDDVHLETRLGEVVYPSIDGFLAGEVDATPLAAAIRAAAPELDEQIRAEIRDALQPFDREGMVRFPCEVHLVSARVG